MYVSNNGRNIFSLTLVALQREKRRCPSPSSTSRRGAERRAPFYSPDQCINVLNSFLHKNTLYKKTENRFVKISEH